MINTKNKYFFIPKRINEILSEGLKTKYDYLSYISEMENFSGIIGIFYKIDNYWYRDMLGFYWHINWLKSSNIIDENGQYLLNV